MAKLGFFLSLIFFDIFCGIYELGFEGVFCDYYVKYIFKYAFNFLFYWVVINSFIDL